MTTSLEYKRTRRPCKALCMVFVKRDRRRNLATLSFTQPEFDIQDLSGSAWLVPAMEQWREQAPVKINLVKGIPCSLHLPSSLPSIGSLYCFLEKRPNFPAPVKGMFFGLLVWLVSYLGLTPLLGFSESGQTESVRRNLMMIAAHSIWGSVLGITATGLAERK